MCTSLGSRAEEVICRPLYIAIVLSLDDDRHGYPSGLDHCGGESMIRMLLIAFALIIPLAAAGDTGRSPCMPINEMRMLHVIEAPVQIVYRDKIYIMNPGLLRHQVKAKYANKTIISKVPAETQIAVKAIKVVPVKAVKHIVKRTRHHGKMKGCKIGRTKDKYGHCGRWK
jgi:hypothetical protein